MQIKQKLKKIRKNIKSNDVWLLRQIKEQIAPIESLDQLKVGKGDAFFNTFKPLFSSKEARRRLILIECIKECLNEYFVNAIDTVNITSHDNISRISLSIDPIANAISKYAQ